MSDPLLTAAIAGISAIVGGVIGGLLRPWGQDWVSRQAESRAATRAAAVARRDRIQTVVDLLALAGTNSDPRQGGAKPQLRGLVRAVGDSKLTDAVEAFCDTTRGEEYWPLLKEAQQLAGDVLARTP